jgi:hypothetical protein
MTKQTKGELAKEASAILKQARCNTMTGAKKDRDYRRNKRADSKRVGRQWRAKQRKLGKFGPASAVRTITTGEKEIESGAKPTKT